MSLAVPWTWSGAHRRRQDDVRTHLSHLREQHAHASPLVRPTLAGEHPVMSKGQPGGEFLVVRDGLLRLGTADLLCERPGPAA